MAEEINKLLKKKSKKHNYTDSDHFSSSVLKEENKEAKKVVDSCDYITVKKKHKRKREEDTETVQDTTSVKKKKKKKKNDKESDLFECNGESSIGITHNERIDEKKRKGEKHVEIVQEISVAADSYVDSSLEDTTSVKKKKKKKKNDKELDLFECNGESSVSMTHNEHTDEKKRKGEKHVDIVQEISVDSSLEDTTSVKKKKKKKKSDKESDLLECNGESSVSMTHNEHINEKKWKGEKHIEIVQEISVAADSYADSSLEDTTSVEKKKKKKKNDKESDLFECNGESSVGITHNEPIDEEKCETSKLDQLLVQRPSYFDKKNKDFINYHDSKRELKRSWYPDLQEDVVLCNEGRHYTLSIALPASILEETCLAHVLRTYVIGQLARTACIFSIDEIVVYNDKCWGDDDANCDKYIGMMKMILEYQECPQYLRKDLFPKHHFMKDAGVLNALNAPHHLLAYQWCDYREGIVLSKYNGKCSFVDIGLKSDVQVDRKLEPGLRVTVRLPPETKSMNKLYGYVVSPEEPRTKTGMYWGYTVRVAHSLSEVFKSDRFVDGYDLIIGTSDKGIDSNDVTFQKFSHALIVFGGVRGLEAAQKADKSLSNSQFDKLFHHYVNICPNQSSRTIRTEEAVLIALSTLCPRLTRMGLAKPR